MDQTVCINWIPHKKEHWCSSILKLLNLWLFYLCTRVYHNIQDNKGLEMVEFLHCNVQNDESQVVWQIYLNRLTTGGKICHFPTSTILLSSMICNNSSVKIRSSSGGSYPPYWFSATVPVVCLSVWLSSVFSNKSIQQITCSVVNLCTLKRQNFKIVR